MKKLILGIALIVVVVIFMRRGGDTPPVNDAGQNNDSAIKVGTKVGNMAPGFTLTDFNGNEVSLSDYKGNKPVFINFWAIWCPFCVKELPVMDNSQKEYGDAYVTLVVNRGEGLDNQKEYLADLGVGDDMTFLLDLDDDIYKKYSGFAMPYSLFLDKDGIVRDFQFGPLTENELRDKLSKILN